MGYSTTQVALVVKNLPASSGDTDSISGQQDMATRSSILAWRIPWTGEPGGLWSVGPQSWTRLKWLSIHAYRFFYAPENRAEENFRHHLIIFKYSEDKARKWCSQQESGRSRTRTQGLRLSIKHSLYKWVSLSPHRLLAQDPSMGHQQGAGKWMSGPGRGLTLLWGRMVMSSLWFATKFLHFCLCSFPLFIIKVRPMMIAPRMVIRRVRMKITAVTP